MNTVNSTSSYPRRNIDFMLRRISMNNRSIGRPQSLAFPLLRLVIEAATDGVPLKRCS